MNLDSQNPKKLIIAICGSYGKTTVKEILNTVLSQKYQVLASFGNQNTPLGISKLVEKLTSQTEILLLEFGEFAKGDIRDLCRLFPPDIGIITGINEQHSERMGGLANAISCMFEMAEFAKTLILNADDQNIVENWSNFVDNWDELENSEKNSKSQNLVLQNSSKAQKNESKTKLQTDQNSQTKKPTKTFFYSAQNHELSNLKFEKAQFDKQKLAWQVEFDQVLLENCQNSKIQASKKSDINSSNLVTNYGLKTVVNQNTTQNINNSENSESSIPKNELRNSTEKMLEEDYSDYQNAKKLSDYSQISSNKETKKIVFGINLLAKYAVGNLVLAILISKILELNNLQIQKGLESVKPVKHRLEPLWNEQNGVLVIDDSYNGNPDGVMAAIEVLARFKE